MLALHSRPCSLRSRPFTNSKQLQCSRHVVTQKPIAVNFYGASVGDKSQVSGLQVSSAETGVKWTMMRHGNRVNRLGRPADQRKALIRSLVTEVLRHGQIKTTKVKAMVVRKYVDNMITLAKKGTLHARRQALAFVYDKELVRNLFAAVPDRYGDRNGGYTRVRAEPMPRRGDAAEMAVIELV